MRNPVWSLDSTIEELLLILIVIRAKGLFFFFPRAYYLDPTSTVALTMFLLKGM